MYQFDSDILKHSCMLEKHSGVPKFVEDGHLAKQRIF